MIVVILIGASIFGYFFTLTHVTQDLVAWVGALPTSRWVMIAIAILVAFPSIILWLPSHMGN
jgi:TRAP-type C4-dicarboxylate transport system permease large subunit